MQHADFLLKMFEKCGFSEENTTWASISHRRARISTDTREILQLLQSTPFAHEAHRGPRRSQQHSARSRGYIFNNTNNEESTIKTIPAVGVCCSPTELLLNKVVYVIYSKFFITFAVDLHLKYGIRPSFCWVETCQQRSVPILYTSKNWIVRWAMTPYL